MQEKSFAVSVKIWALCCTLIGVSLTGTSLLTWILSCAAFAYLAVQRKWKLICSFGVFYLLLALLLYAIRFHGLRMVIFSEFYVLMFWNLFPVFAVSWDLVTTPPGEISAFLSRLHIPTSMILGILVVFRFFPTMKTELAAVGRSMKNRGLTAPLQIIRHPASSCEYVLIPFLLRVLQIADQLSVSAVARGAEHPGIRGSYYGKKMQMRDYVWIVLWGAITAGFLTIGGMRL
ncbi:MAG: energy-coupling factor transporter transmembrane protein EcfT [Clostridiales bacterium]|nr:energy-coupling factor transporter transmembrane protein EcfT [Clostridiales bacterium]